MQQAFAKNYFDYQESRYDIYYKPKHFHEFILFDIIYMSNINLNAKSKYNIKCTFKVTHMHK